MPVPRANVEMEIKSGGFTLIELLVVIVIVAILTGLAFPVFSSIQNQARKAQAKNDVTQIVTAVNAFYTEYEKYPTSATTDANATYGTSNNSAALFNELRGKGALLNTRQIVFISPAEDPSQPNPKGKIGSDGQFYDPWGSAYSVRMDADYDNQISPNPYGANNGAGPDPLRQGVIAWSYGKDAKLGKDGDSKFRGSDDVISWQ